MGHRMTSDLAVAALRNAVALRLDEPSPAAGPVVHSDRGSQGGFNRSSQHLVIVEVFSGGDEGLGREDERCARGDAPAVACGSGAEAADALSWTA